MPRGLTRTCRNRALVALGTGISVSVAILVSCSFPEVTFTDGPGSGGDGNLETAPRDAPSDATADTALLEGSVRDDATANVPEGSCVPEDCDCDKDTWLRGNCDSGTLHPTRLDCDDLDPLRHPDADPSQELPPPGQVPPGDWNCDGKVDKAYEINIKCVSNIVSCTGGPGFTNDPTCGTKAAYYECKDLGIPKGGCQEVLKDQRVQLCQ